jgi:hypothetical protein
MRITSQVTSVSWIPSEAVKGLPRLGFDLGLGHYDDPLPDRVEDLEALRTADRFRFANVLAAWIEVSDGQIVDAGYAGRGLIGSTTLRLGPVAHTFAAFALPDLQHPPESGPDRVRFVQTSGGRTGLPAPRTVRRKPYIQLRAPLAWTTLALTLYADGRSEWEVMGASRFPRHWVYDAGGALVAKVGMADFREWWQHSFGRHTPWGDEESPALVTAAETALERALADRIMRGGAKPIVREHPPETVLMRQGEEADDVLLLLDGVVRIEHDGQRLTELGPGALLGERAGLERGRRTAKVTAVTPCRVAVAAAGALDPAALEEVSRGHRREEAPAP